MKYSLLLFGILFLVTPELSFLDVLPDFIGLLLLSKALSYLSEISPSAESAVQLLRRGALISGIQCAFILPMMSVTVSDSALQLLFVVVFHLLRLLYLIPAFRDLFAALRYLSDKHGTSLPLLSVLSVFAPIALVCHTALTILPQLVFLKVEEFGVRYPLTADVGANGRTTYQTLLHFSLLSSLLLFTLWSLLFIVFFVSLKRKREWNQSIREAVAAAPRSLSKAVLSSVKPSLSLLTAAAFCSVVLSLDGLPLLPPALAPFLLFLAMGRLSKVSLKGKKRTFRFLPILGAVAGLLLHLFLYIFCEMYGETALYDFASVERPFSLPMTMEIVYSIFMILTQLAFYPQLRQLIREHTGCFWESAYLTHNSLVGKEQAHQLFSLRLLTLLSVIHSLTGTLSYAVLYTHPTYQILNTLFGLAVAIFASSLYAQILSSVKEKYADESVRSESN